MIQVVAQQVDLGEGGTTPVQTCCRTGATPSIIHCEIGVSETGSAKTGSAIDVRIDDAGSILKLRGRY